MQTLAAVQMVSTDSVAANLRAAAAGIASAVAAGATFVSLPEYFSLMPADPAARLGAAEAAGDGPVQTFLAEQAARHRIWLLGGTIPLRSDDPDRVRNASLLFAPDGTRHARYDKVHLFALTTADATVDESQVLQPGGEIVVAEVESIRIGLSVCYDLRFPELYRAMAPVDVLCVPSAFTWRTGSRHWEVLLRARAIENQCYVLAAAQGGTHSGGHRTWGHSLVIDPWGEVLSCVNDGEGVAIAACDPTRVRDVRAALPALQHRRPLPALRSFGNAAATDL
jgi:deaminated glutathione amidase